MLVAQSPHPLTPREALPLIYLDHAATTPLAPQAAAAMDRAASCFWANPSSVHTPGRAARAALEEARESLAAALNLKKYSLIFTSSASEANNLALKGRVYGRVGHPQHLVVSAIEHDSMRHTARYLAKTVPHVTLTEVPPDSNGVVSPSAIQAAIRPETMLVALMHANNETGAIQPVPQVARMLKSSPDYRNIALLCDAVQSFGKIPLDCEALGCDYMTLSAHKFNGPRGAGALVVSPRCSCDPLIHGGTQESGHRAGTENLPAIAGMAAAAQLAVARLAETQSHLARLEALFLAALCAAELPFQLNGPAADKLPGMINLSIPDLAQDDLIVGMDLAGFAISAGSACSSGVVEPSHVLQAMSLPEWRTRGSIRISFGPGNTPAEAESAADALAALAQRLEAELPASGAQSR